MRGWRAYLLSHGSWPARESGRHFATEEEEEEEEEEERGRCLFWCQLELKEKGMLCCQQSPPLKHAEGSFAHR